MKNVVDCLDYDNIYEALKGELIAMFQECFDGGFIKQVDGYNIFGDDDFFGNKAYNIINELTDILNIIVLPEDEIGD